jgi:hypothetical protein
MQFVNQMIDLLGDASIAAIIAAIYAAFFALGELIAPFLFGL